MEFRRVLFRSRMNSHSIMAGTAMSTSQATSTVSKVLRGEENRLARIQPMAPWCSRGGGRLGAVGVWVLISAPPALCACYTNRSEEHTSELQSLMRSSYAVFCLIKKNTTMIITDLSPNYTNHQETR